MEITYSYMSADDIPQVAELEKKAFRQPWSEQGISHYNDAGQTLFIVAKTDDGCVIGYAALFCVLDEGNLVSITVDEKYRNMGIATELLDIVCSEAKANDITNINLEVRKSNEAAITLYKKEGFRQIGVRKGFYDKPKEDAILFEKKQEL